MRVDKEGKAVRLLGLTRARAFDCEDQARSMPAKDCQEEEEKDNLLLSNRFHILVLDPYLYSLHLIQKIISNVKLESCYTAVDKITQIAV